ncbi:hypothetical protein A8144_11685 [Mycobacterium leprae 3125609]|nr:hypothetical protein A8144_11685 [Mycobacterium leprae 3125609]OAX70592.1 hypothetical protein A3216_11125 [Mycobacterium leprae 7935681]
MNHVADIHRVPDELVYTANAHRLASFHGDGGCRIAVLDDYQHRDTEPGCYQRITLQGHPGTYLPIGLMRSKSSSRTGP